MDNRERKSGTEKATTKKMGRSKTWTPGLKMNPTKALYTTMTIRRIPIEFKLDTGADANVLSLEQIRNLPGDVALKPRDHASGIWRHKDQTSWLCIPEVPQRTKWMLFFVTEQSTPPILGRVACEQLNLVKRIEQVGATVPATKDELVKQYPEIFQGLG